MNQIEKNKSTALYIIPAVLILLVSGYFLYSQTLKKNNQTNTEQTPSNPETFTMEELQKQVPSPAAAEPTPTANQKAETNGIRTITITANNFAFQPNVIKVKQNEKIKLVFKSVDMMHDFNIDALGFSMPFTSPGETNSIEISFDKVGEYEFYCSVGNHRQRGQVGKLIVE